MTLATSSKATALCIVPFAAWPTAQAASTRFRIDPAHTRIAFRVSHLGLSQSTGALSGANGSLDLDPGNRADFGMSAYPGAVGENAAIATEAGDETAAPNDPASPPRASIPQDSNR